jgi:cell division protein FtsB
VDDSDSKWDHWGPLTSPDPEECVLRDPCEIEQESAGRSRAFADFWSNLRSLLHPDLVQRSLQRFLPLAVLGISALSVLWMLWSPQGLSRLDVLQRERTGLNDEIERVSRDIERLRYEVQRIKTSPSSVERVARDELGLVRQTEFVVHFSKDELTPPRVVPFSEP